MLALIVMYGFTVKRPPCPRQCRRPARCCHALSLFILSEPSRKGAGSLFDEAQAAVRRANDNEVTTRERR